MSISELFCFVFVLRVVDEAGMSELELPATYIGAGSWELEASSSDEPLPKPPCRVQRAEWCRVQSAERGYPTQGLDSRRFKDGCVQVGMYLGTCKRGGSPCVPAARGHTSAGRGPFLGRCGFCRPLAIENRCFQGPTGWSIGISGSQLIAHPTFNLPPPTEQSTPRPRHIPNPQHQLLPFLDKTKEVSCVCTSSLILTPLYTFNRHHHQLVKMVCCASHPLHRHLAS